MRQLRTECNLSVKCVRITFVVCSEHQFMELCPTLRMRATLDLDSWYKLYSVMATLLVAASLRIALCWQKHGASREPLLEGVRSRSRSPSMDAPGSCAVVRWWVNPATLLQVRAKVTSVLPHPCRVLMSDGHFGQAKFEAPRCTEHGEPEGLQCLLLRLRIRRSRSEDMRVLQTAQLTPFALQLETQRNVRIVCQEHCSAAIVYCRQKDAQGLPGTRRCGGEATSRSPSTCMLGPVPITPCLRNSP
jgi:hypothetical protein